MKKVISLVFVLVVMLGCAGLVACGEPEPLAPSERGVTVPSVTGLPWSDVPAYPGAKQVQEGSWEIPVTEGEWTTMEWRYYETRDSVSEVVAFYKSQMYGKGWSKRGWMEMPEISWCTYTKNNATEGAMVWITSDEGETIIALMRGAQ